MPANSISPFMGGLCQRCGSGGGISIGGCKRSMNVRKREADYVDFDNYVDYEDAANYF